MTWILASRKALQARYGSDAAIQAQPCMLSHKFGGFHLTFPEPRNRSPGGYGDRDPHGSSWEASQGDPPACFDIFSLQSAHHKGPNTRAPLGTNSPAYRILYATSMLPFVGKDQPSRRLGQWRSFVNVFSR